MPNSISSDYIPPQLPRNVPPPPTTADLDWASLPVVDLSKCVTPEGKQEVVRTLRDAMTEQGFFYVVNHGYTKAQWERIFDIADVPFSQVTAEEKREHSNAFATTGSYEGYKLRHSWEIEGGIRDQFEEYNVARGGDKSQPQALQPLLQEIRQFGEHNHSDVVLPILRLLALGLELPEDALEKFHQASSVAFGESLTAFIKYYPRSQDEEELTNSVWHKGHTDFGSLSILYSQPVSGLQVMTPEGEWKWVKYMENALVINAGDALEFLSGGFYRATIHRVVQPPKDQRGVVRLGVFYFARFDDNTKLVPLAESPVLKRVGIKRLCEDNAAPTMKLWRSERASTYGVVELTASKENADVEEEIVAGVRVKHYN